MWIKIHSLLKKYAYFKAFISRYVRVDHFDAPVDYFINIKKGKKAPSGSYISFK